MQKKLYENKILEMSSAQIADMAARMAEGRLPLHFAEDFKSVLKRQLACYPEMTEQDTEKLCFQSLFGGGHLIADEASCLAFLVSEWQSVIRDGLMHAPFLRMQCTSENPYSGRASGSAASLCEPIGGGHCRFPLCAIPDTKQANYALAALNRLFILSAALTQKQNGEVLRPAVPPFRHSAAFRTAYHPAYRILRQELSVLFPLFSEIERLQSEQPLTVIAIDGMCGSGKTSLAAFLQSVYSCSIIHADDFFLPPELRTDKRYAEPGGNIHYERFLSEITEKLCAYKRQARTGAGTQSAQITQTMHLPASLSYRRFSCSDMTYQEEPVQIPLTPLIIVEGSYCLRPEFCSAYDLSVFLSCPKETQKERILKRNGPEMLRMFQEKWIPMENRYFDFYKIREKAGFLFS